MRIWDQELARLSVRADEDWGWVLGRPTTDKPFVHRVRMFITRNPSILAGLLHDDPAVLAQLIDKIIRKNSRLYHGPNALRKQKIQIVSRVKEWFEARDPAAILSELAREPKK